MTVMMIGPVLFLAAMASPQAQSTFQPIGGATARATASVRIVSGVRFGHGRLADAPGAIRRPAMLTDREGRSRPAELLEFQ
jgi:hypothetical protein